MIDTIRQWAKCEKAIRAVIMTGSRATDTHDELSDYDLVLFCTHVDSFTCDDAWLSKIAKVSICIHEKIFLKEKEFCSRLVIFENGVKVDFSLYPVEILNDVRSLPFQSAYKVLLDKDGMISSLPSLGKEFSAVVKPNSELFLTTINEFWFEAYHVAVYVKRKDLWSAQFRLSGLHHQFLLKMIEWNELSKCNWKGRFPELGKKMQVWASRDTWDALRHSFAHFDAEDIWQALENTMNLFRTLAYQTAAQLGYQYLNEADICITKCINELKGKL